MRNNLDGDSFRFRARLVADVMYVSAAYVSEALADTVGRGRAIVLVNRDRSFCHCDQTGTGMGVPPTLAPGLEGVLGDVEVGVASHPRDEKPIRQVASTHQVERAGWEVARRDRFQQVFAYNTARRRCTRRHCCERGDDQRWCDEMWQN